MDSDVDGGGNRDVTDDATNTATGGGSSPNIDVHKLGVWLVAFGTAAMTIGLVADAIRHANDPALSAREGIFDLAGVPHALFFGGIAVAILGLLAMLSAKLYKPGARVTVGRRLAQVGAPLAAVVLIAGCATRREQLRARRAVARSGRGSLPRRHRGGHHRSRRRSRAHRRRYGREHRRDEQRGGYRRARGTKPRRSHRRSTTRRSRSTSRVSRASRPSSRRAPRTSSRSP